MSIEDQIKAETDALDKIREDNRRVHVTVRLPNHLRDRIRKHCEQSGITYSSFIEHSLVSYMEGIKE